MAVEMMNSLAFSSVAKLKKIVVPIINVEKKSNAKCEDPKKKLKLKLNRREAISVGLFISIGQVEVVNSGIALAAAEADSSSPSLCQLIMAPSGLAFCDKVVGTGPLPLKGQLIKAHYVGKLENGKVFDSSYNRAKPLTFRLGVGEVIKGWDEGILGGDGVPPMQPGGKRILKLPPQLGYGVRGAGCKGGQCIIPPDSVLFFDVEFLGKA